MINIPGSLTDNNFLFTKANRNTWVTQYCLSQSCYWLRRDEGWRGEFWDDGKAGKSWSGQKNAVLIVRLWKGFVGKSGCTYSQGFNIRASKSSPIYLLSHYCLSSEGNQYNCYQEAQPVKQLEGKTRQDSILPPSLALQLQCYNTIDLPPCQENWNAVALCFQNK